MLKHLGPLRGSDWVTAAGIGSSEQIANTAKDLAVAVSERIENGEVVAVGSFGIGRRSAGGPPARDKICRPLLEPGSFAAPDHTKEWHQLRCRQLPEAQQRAGSDCLLHGHRQIAIDRRS